MTLRCGEVMGLWLQVRAALQEAFAGCGELNQVRLPTDRETGELKGIAFIEFADAEAKVPPFPSAAPSPSPQSCV